MTTIMMQKRHWMDTKTSSSVVVWSQPWDAPLDGLHFFFQVSLLLPQDDPREGTVRAPQPGDLCSSLKWSLWDGCVLLPLPLTTESDCASVTTECDYIWRWGLWKVNDELEGRSWGQDLIHTWLLSLKEGNLDMRYVQSRDLRGVHKEGPGKDTQRRGLSTSRGVASGEPKVLKPWSWLLGPQVSFGCVSHMSTGFSYGSLRKLM